MYIPVNARCTGRRMDVAALPLHVVYMAEEAHPRHHLRAWRKHRGYTLEAVAERVGGAGKEI